MRTLILAFFMGFFLTACIVEDDPTGACYTDNYCSDDTSTCPSGSDWTFEEGKSCADVKDKTSSGNGSGSGSCGNYYDRGLTDIQVKTQCQAAWAYSCQSHSAGVNATCSILDGYKSISKGGNPKDKCPYCD